MHLPFAHTCKTSRRTPSFQAEVPMVLHKKSTLLLLHMNNRASRSFLNVASFQNFLKMGMEVCFSLMLCISSIQTHLSEIFIYTGKQCLHYLKITTLLDTGMLMIHHQSNEYNYFVFQLSLWIHHCLSKFGRPTKKIYVRLYIFIKLSRKRKENVNLSSSMLLNAILRSGTILNTEMGIYEKLPN